MFTRPSLTRLDRYIFRQGAVPFLLILLCTTAVIWLTQVLQRVDLMVDDGGGVISFLKVTVLLIPSLLAVIIPFAILAASLYALNLFATDSELPVMGAAGASRIRIGRPLILLSVLAAAFVFYLNVDLQPRSYRLLKETVEDIQSDIARNFLRAGIFSEVMDNVTVYAEEVRPGDQYVGLFIHDRSDPGEIRTYTAERGLFQNTGSGPKLLLVRGTVQYSNPDTGSIDIIRFVETAVDLAAFKQEGGNRNREVTERYLSELLSPDMENPWEAERAGRLIAEGHARLSTPLYAPAFAIAALAAMLLSTSSRRGYGRALLTAIGAAVLLRTAGYVVQTAASSTPSLNALQYAVPLVGIVVGLVLLAGTFWRVKRRPPPALSTVLAHPEAVSDTAAAEGQPA